MDALENGLAKSWNDSGFRLRADHCICFAGSTLTVGQDATIVTVQQGFHHFLSNVLKYLCISVCAPSVLLLILDNESSFKLGFTSESSKHSRASQSGL